jgi:hypothetical protein
MLNNCKRTLNRFSVFPNPPIQVSSDNLIDRDQSVRIHFGSEVLAITRVGRKSFLQTLENELLGNEG